MTDYVVIPYDGGKGWLMVRGYGLNSEIGDGVSFLYKRPYSSVRTNTLYKEEGGFQLEAQHRHLYIYNSPFEALKRIGQALTAPIIKTGDNIYRGAGTSIAIINEDSRGTTWKFI